MNSPPVPGMLNVMVFVPPVAAFESVIALRSDPTPESAALVTTKVDGITRRSSGSIAGAAIRRRRVGAPRDRAGRPGPGVLSRCAIIGGDSLARRGRSG